MEEAVEDEDFIRVGVLELKPFNCLLPNCVLHCCHWFLKLHCMEECTMGIWERKTYRQGSTLSRGVFRVDP